MAFQPASYSVPLTNSSASGCSGASVTKVTPNNVSGRVVKTRMVLSLPSIPNSISAPSERPSQSSCINRTLSGNSMVSNPSSNCCAYFVISMNHWLISFCRTGPLQRQHRPALTCSLARTVEQHSHQLTGANSRYASPDLKNRVKNN